MQLGGNVIVGFHSSARHAMAVMAMNAGFLDGRDQGMGNKDIRATAFRVLCFWISRRSPDKCWATEAEGRAAVLRCFRRALAIWVDPRRQQTTIHRCVYLHKRCTLAELQVCHYLQGLSHLCVTKNVSHNSLCRTLISCEVTKFLLWHWARRYGDANMMDIPVSIEYNMPTLYHASTHHAPS